MGYSAQIPLDVNPQVAAALEQLGVLLEDHHYSAYAKARILAYTAREGTPTGCRYLDREDEADAEQVFADSLPAVPPDSPAWDRDTSVIFDVEMLAEGVHPWPIPTRPEDDDTRAVPPDAVLLPPELEPEFELDRFEPSPEDWEALRRWALEVEAGCLGLSIPPVSGGAPEPEPAAPAPVEGTIVVAHIQAPDGRTVRVYMDSRPSVHMAEGEEVGS
jgi:hypothetical protein